MVSKEILPSSKGKGQWRKASLAYELKCGHCFFFFPEMSVWKLTACFFCIWLITTYLTVIEVILLTVPLRMQNVSFHMFPLFAFYLLCPPPPAYFRQFSEEETWTAHFRMHKVGFRLTFGDAAQAEMSRYLLCLSWMFTLQF